jgi:hypothetical protein
MGFDLHNVHLLNGSKPLAFADRLLVGVARAVLS